MISMNMSHLKHHTHQLNKNDDENNDSNHDLIRFDLIVEHFILILRFSNKKLKKIGKKNNLKSS